MQYKLICSDIDGTLLNKDRQLSKRTIAAIMQLKNKIPVVLISSRMPKAMQHLQQELDIMRNPLIAFNGGLILDYSGEKPVSLLSEEIPLRIAADIVKFNGELSFHTSLYHNDEWYVPEMDYWANREKKTTKVEPIPADLNEVCTDWSKRNIGPHKIMCMGEAPEIDQLSEYLNANYSDQLHCYRSKDTYLEIASKKISKLSALELLLEKKYAIDLSEVIAFGDNYNDVEMINGVGHGVAMENARDEVKAVANQLTAKNTDDGVAMVLEAIFG